MYKSVLAHLPILLRTEGGGAVNKYFPRYVGPVPIEALHNIINFFIFIVKKRYLVSMHTGFK